MSHGFDAVDDTKTAELASAAGPLRLADRALGLVNRLIAILGSIALVAASLVLTYSVIVRYFLRLPTDWQDEMAVFLLVGSVFLASAGVQARRGHVAIEALSSILPKMVNGIRLIVVDALSCAFCAFFAWKSWALLVEAWTEDQHSETIWGPPLWIPYSLMTFGMGLLALQILIQFLDGLGRGGRDE